MNDYKISHFALDLSSSKPNVTSSQCVLPTEMPSDLDSYTRSKPHSDFVPNKNCSIIAHHLGFTINLDKSIGCGSYAKCFVGTRLAKGSSKAFSSGEQQVCFKITDMGRLSSNYRYNFLPRENFALSLMTGPNLVKTFESLSMELILNDKCALHYLVTLQELLPHSLLDLCFDSKAVKRIIPSEVTRRIGVQLIDGVAFMHTKGVSHRDVKIGNLMLDSNYSLKIIDFGLCHLSTPQGTNQNNIPSEALLSETWCGTRAYLSPELILRHEYSPSLYDAWLTGMVLYEMTNYRLPDIYDRVSRDGIFDDKIITFDTSPPEYIMSFLKKLLVSEQNRMSVEESKKQIFYTDFDETHFWSEYNSGKFVKIFDVLEVKHSLIKVT